MQWAVILGRCLPAGDAELTRISDTHLKLKIRLFCLDAVNLCRGRPALAAWQLARSYSFIARPWHTSCVAVDTKNFRLLPCRRKVAADV